MLDIAIDNLVSPIVVHVVGKDLLGEQIDERLDAGCHLIGALRIVCGLNQVREVVGSIGHLEALDVELVLEKYCVVVNLLFLAKVAPNLVSKCQYGLNYLLLAKLVVFIVIVVLVHSKPEVLPIFVELSWVLVQLLLFLT